SDAHAGLVGAIAANLPGAAWQRCRTHYSANLMAVCPKSMWPAVKAMLHSVYDQPNDTAVKAMLHSVYDQPNDTAVHEQFDRLLEYTEGRLPDVAEHLGDAREDLLAFTVFPDDVWRQ
ncbi:transposase, partial [Rhodococcus sp. HS-D2]|uniref:transposase n=1 Tax=Rhodococcus sp. HS-D2 TaxID=1384636 RepID=UPI000B08D6BA